MIFRWGGLYDGRYDTLTLQNLVVTDDKYENVRQNVSKCDLVIVDEVSMLSLKEFEQFETVCRVVRGNNSFFG